MTRAPNGAHGTTFMIAFARQAFGAATRAIVKLRHRREVQSLHKLDDRLLADIGLRRADVTSALDSSYDVDPSAHLVMLRGDHLQHARIHAPPGGETRMEWVRPSDASLKTSAGFDLKPC
jgi:uncharacterized protein YjiS (DUF1127 family)